MNTINVQTYVRTCTYGRTYLHFQHFVSALRCRDKKQWRLNHQIYQFQVMVFLWKASCRDVTCSLSLLCILYYLNRSRTLNNSRPQIVAGSFHVTLCKWPFQNSSKLGVYVLLVWFQTLPFPWKIKIRGGGGKDLGKWPTLQCRAGISFIPARGWKDTCV